MDAKLKYYVNDLAVLDLLPKSIGPCSEGNFGDSNYPTSGRFLLSRVVEMDVVASGVCKRSWAGH